jgi:hypothetical protein
LKLFKWSYKALKGTVVASTIGEAKQLLAGKLRDAKDKCIRLPKGTVIDKIGRTNEPVGVVVTEDNSQAASLAAMGDRMKQKMQHQAEVVVASRTYEELKKDKVFSGGVAYYEDGTWQYVGDGGELHLKKGTKVCWSKV